MRLIIFIIRKHPEIVYIFNHRYNCNLSPSNIHIIKATPGNKSVRIHFVIRCEQEKEKSFFEIMKGTIIYKIKKYRHTRKSKIPSISFFYDKNYENNLFSLFDHMNKING